MFERIAGLIPGVAEKRKAAEEERARRAHIRQVLDNLEFKVPFDAREITVLELDSQFELGWRIRNPNGSTTTQIYLSDERGEVVEALVAAGVPVQRIPGRLVL